MNTTWFSLALVGLLSTLVAAAPLPGTPKILSSSDNPALIVKNVEIDAHDGKIRGTVYLRFGYESPRLPHVHVYALNASGRVVAEGCDKLSAEILSNHRGAGKGHEGFVANLGNLSKVATVRVVASAEHSRDCKLADNRILKLF